MQVGSGSCTYEWIDNWARIPDAPSGRENGRTHGVEVLADGRVVVFNQADPAVLILDADGNLLESWGDRFAGAHGLSLTRDNGQEQLWLTDQASCEVVRTSLDGQSLQTIDRPDVPAYREGGKYSPTWVAVNPANGDVWVTDGYGSGLVHRYDRTGRHLSTLDGDGGAGRFKCPHAIWFDSRKSEPALYVADRGNRRVQVFDGEGAFNRVFGEDFLTSPCSFAAHGDLLLMPELRARVTILDGDDKLVCHLGENEQVCDIEGWPNHKGELIQPGRFNSPHDMVADAAGNLYVVEWIIGGRITKLARS
jgi:hypothetical protein